MFPVSVGFPLKTGFFFQTRFQYVIRAYDRKKHKKWVAFSEGGLGETSLWPPKRGLPQKSSQKFSLKRLLPLERRDGLWYNTADCEIIDKRKVCLCPVPPYWLAKTPATIIPP